MTLNGLNVRAKTTKLLEENLGVHLYDFRFGNRLLDMTLKARTTKEKQIHQTLSKLKFHVLKNIIKETEKKTQRMGEYFLRITYYIKNLYLGCTVDPFTAQELGHLCLTIKIYVQLWSVLMSTVLYLGLQPSSVCVVLWCVLNETICSVQFSSVSQPCPTLCDPMNRSTPHLPVHHQLLEATQTQVHQVSDAIQPSHPLSSPSPPALNLSQHQGLFK